MKKITTTIFISIIFGINATAQNLTSNEKILQHKIDSLQYRIYELENELAQYKDTKSSLPWGSKVYAKPVSYDNKKKTQFKVFQSLSGYALANEGEQKSYGWSYLGPVVVLLGDYYDQQVVKIKNPKILGTYSYSTRNDREITAPIISGE